MNTERLLPAVLASGVWLERFRKRSYPGAFREYCETYGPLYEEALAEVPPEEAAESLLDGLADFWKHSRPWNRTALRIDAQQMLVSYFTPMLLELEGENPACGALEEAVRTAWGRRWPGEAYQAADFETLQSGFRDTFMGIELRGSRRDP